MAKRLISLPAGARTMSFTLWVKALRAIFGVKFSGPSRGRANQKWPWLECLEERLAPSLTPTTTTVGAAVGAASVSTVNYGTQVTLTATVSPNTGATAPTLGTVDFQDVSASLDLGVITTDTVFGTSAIFTFVTTANELVVLQAAGGIHVITATYSAGAGFAGSSRSLAGGLGVAPAPLTITMSGTSSWISAGSMATARFADTATLLNNGNVLAAGGTSNNQWGGYLSSAELFNPITNAWSAAASMASPRYAPAAALLPNGKVLLAGGRNPGALGDELASAELYDATTNTWSSAGSMAYPRETETATVLNNGLVLIAGGYGVVTFQSGHSIGPLTQAELYNPSTNTWSAAGSMTAGRESQTATLLNNGQVLVTGGYGNGYLSSAELYDPTSNSWYNVTPMTFARFGQTATLLPNGQVLVVGGYSSNGILASAELYNPISSTWTPAASMATPRYLHTATLLTSGEVLVAGGQGPNGDLSSAELYDPATNTWSSAGSMAYSREQQTATLLANGRVLIAGSLSLQSAAEVFVPASSPLALSKVYDATTTATLITGSLVLSGVKSGDTVNLGTSGAGGTFKSANVGNGITVATTGFTISGAQASDYTLTQPTTTASIAPAALTLTATTNTKVFDGTTNAAAQPLVSGLKGNDTVTAAEIYTSPVIGFGKSLIVSDYTVNDGNGGNNYSVTKVSSSTGAITGGSSTTLNFLGSGLEILIVPGYSINLSTTGGAQATDTTPGQSISDATGKFTISGPPANQTPTEKSGLSSDFSTLTTTGTGTGRGQTVNFLGGSFIPTNVSDGTIPIVNFTTVISTFTGDVNVVAATNCSVNAPISGSGSINIAIGGTNAALNVNNNVTSQGGALTLQSTGAVIIAPGVTVSSGSGSLTLGADLTPAGAGDDGIGTLTIGAGATVYGTNIVLRGADEDIASTANVGSSLSPPGTPVATAPSAILTGLNNPNALLFDNSGNLYVSNFAGGTGTTVSKFSPGATVASATLTGLNGPDGLAFDGSGNLYVANEFSGGNNGTTVSVFTPGASTPSATLGGLDRPTALTFDASGNLYVANLGNGTVSKFAPGATQPSSILTGLNRPLALAFDNNGDLFVANYGGNTVSEYLPGATTPSATLTGLSGPGALTFDKSGNLYVTNSNANTVSEFAPGAIMPSVTLNPNGSPDALAFDANGRLYVGNGSGSVAIFAPGATTPSFSLTGLDNVPAVTLDNHGKLYVASYNVGKVSVFPLGPTAVSIRSSVPTRPISLGGTNNAAVPGINLTSAELARIVTTPNGTITIGDSNQTGNITFSMATLATTAGASTIALQSTSGAGSIVLDDGGGGAGTALNGNGGTVNIIAGTGGIVALAANNSAAEIATTGATVTLNTAGSVGTSTNRIQFADNGNAAQQNVLIGATNQPNFIYLDGLGSLTLGTIQGGTIDSTSRGNLTVAANGTVGSGAGALSLGADLTAAGAGDNGVGTLSIGAGAIIYGKNITLRGADVDIDPTATVGPYVEVKTFVAGNQGLNSPAAPAFLTKVAIFTSPTRAIIQSARSRRAARSAPSCKTTRDLARP